MYKPYIKELSDELVMRLRDRALAYQAQSPGFKTSNNNVSDS